MIKQIKLNKTMFLNSCKVFFNKVVAIQSWNILLLN
jgi:hypothetical protein